MNDREKLAGIGAIAADWGDKSSDMTGLQAMEKIRQLLEPGPIRTLTVDDECDFPMAVDVWAWTTNIPRAEDVAAHPDRVFATTIEGGEVVRYEGKFTRRTVVDPTLYKARVDKIKKELGVETANELEQ